MRMTEGKREKRKEGKYRRKEGNEGSKTKTRAKGGKRRKN